MCDAPGCSGARRGDVFVGGQHCGSACSPQCARSIGAQYASIGTPLSTMSEMRAAILDLVDRVAALEKVHPIAETPASSFKLWPNAPAAPSSSGVPAPIDTDKRPASNFKLWPNAPAAPSSSGVPAPIDADKRPASSFKLWPNAPEATYSTAPSSSDVPDPIDTDKRPASSFKLWPALGQR